MAIRVVILLDCVLSQDWSKRRVLVSLMRVTGSSVSIFSICTRTEVINASKVSEASKVMQQVHTNYRVREYTYL